MSQARVNLVRKKQKHGCEVERLGKFDKADYLEDVLLGASEKTHCFIHVRVSFNYESSFVDHDVPTKLGRVPDQVASSALNLLDNIVGNWPALVTEK